MAKDLQTYRGYDKKMKDAQVEMQSQDPAPDATYKEQLQQKLAKILQDKQDFPAMLQEKYKIQDVQGQFQYPISSPRDLDTAIKRMEPAIERAYHEQQQQKAVEQQFNQQLQEHYTKVQPTPSPPPPPQAQPSAGRETVEQYLQRREQPDPLRPTEGRGERYAEQVREASKHDLVEKAYTAMQELQATRVRRQAVGDQYAQQHGGQAQQSSSQLTDKQLERVYQYYKRLEQEGHYFQNAGSFRDHEVQQYLDNRTRDATWAIQILEQKNGARLKQIDSRYTPPGPGDDLVERARAIRKEALDRKAQDWQPCRQLSEHDMYKRALSDEHARGFITEQEHLKALTEFRQQMRERERVQGRSYGKTS